MKWWRGSLVLALCSLFFGHSDSKAQGVYFLNTSYVAMDVNVDAWDSNGGYIQDVYTLQPGQYQLLDGNVMYDNTGGVEYGYAWYTSLGSGGQLDWPDIQAHYTNYGPVIWIPINRGGEELAVGRAVIENTSANNYQFQGQTVPAGETVAFLTPANDAMWNSIWEEVTRFGTLVTQPNSLQYDAAGNWRNLDWQEKMMWWGGAADPIEWAWYTWDGQTFTHLGNPMDGTVPAGSGIATPPVAPVSPNWGNIGTGNTNPPTTFTPPEGGGGTGGGGTGGGGTGGGGTGGGGTGTGGNGNGAIYVTVNTDGLALESTQLEIKEDVTKIRQHTWNTNQKLEDIKDLLDNDPKKAQAEQEQAQKEQEANNEAGVQAQAAANAGAAEFANFEDENFFDVWDVLMNNLNGAKGGGFDPVVFHIAGQEVVISPHVGVWATFLPWMKGLLALVIMCYFSKRIWDQYSMFFLGLGQTAPVNSNLAISVAGNAAHGVSTPVNIGIQGAAFLLFISFGLFMVTTIGASTCMVELYAWMDVAFDPSTVAGATGPTYNWMAIMLDWAFASLPIVCAVELIIMYYGLSLAMNAAYYGSVFGMKAGSI